MSRPHRTFVVASRDIHQPLATVYAAAAGIALAPPREGGGRRVTTIHSSTALPVERIHVDVSAGASSAAVTCRLNEMNPDRTHVELEVRVAARGIRDRLRVAVGGRRAIERRCNRVLRRLGQLAAHERVQELRREA